jgi:hypothetical protein
MYMVFLKEKCRQPRLSLIFENFLKLFLNIIYLKTLNTNLFNTLKVNFLRSVLMSRRRAELGVVEEEGGRAGWTGRGGCEERTGHSRSFRLWRASLSFRFPPCLRPSKFQPNLGPLPFPLLFYKLGGTHPPTLSSESMILTRPEVTHTFRFS